MRMLVRCVLHVNETCATSPDALASCSSIIFFTPCAAVLTVIDGRWLERTFGRDDDRPTTAQAGEWAAPLRRLSEAEDEEIARANGVLVINKVRDDPGPYIQLLSILCQVSCGADACHISPPGRPDAGRRFPGSALAGGGGSDVCEWQIQVPTRRRRLCAGTSVFRATQGLKPDLSAVFV